MNPINNQVRSDDYWSETTEELFRKDANWVEEAKDGETNDYWSETDDICMFFILNAEKCFGFKPDKLLTTTTPLRIAFTGKAGAGKTTASSYLINKIEGRRVSFAEPLYRILANIQSTFGFPISKQREPLQWVGEWARKHSIINNYDDPILKIAKAEIECDDSINQCVVIDDLRMKVEYDLLKRLDFFIFRISGRQHSSENMSGGSMAHKTEVDLDDVTIDTIDNNGTVEEFHKALDFEIMKCAVINYVRETHECDLANMFQSLALNVNMEKFNQARANAKFLNRLLGFINVGDTHLKDLYQRVQKCE